MISTVVLGFGNVGKHLCLALEQSDAAQLVQIYNRSESEVPESLQKVEFIHELGDLTRADLYLIALPDDAIKSFSDKLKKHNSVVAHTSGSKSLEALKKHDRAGVFYPLQTFSSERTMDLRTVPICIEAKHPEDEAMLVQLAESISEKVKVISSEERKKLHLAAVFASNFPNHLYHMASEILGEHQLDFDLLKPLIAETADKIQSLPPVDAQTGPARRGDENTIENHLHLLTNSRFREIYELLTHSIKETYGKKL
ncbi:DUF2520 domain-containing protein [Aureitalea sp. L0-47]|uniref:Rossmann-like and DUF2520 domain-containing protein n=1 Tax=Aureitalea sp. L0-47 TaxID=2816962 RepID=UPI0022370FF8|nr:DUF2520 domain-containing protein [Aureitalea sp. L0-47]MCW5520482.1 DUF2520 domain-containing protein [Aureitalea sp. L0-47]